jgi:hypothetical protein
MVAARQSGYIALVAVLVLGAAALSISMALLLTGVDSQRSSLISQRYAQAQSLARYCGEEALQQIHDNIAFTTPAAGTNVSAGQGSCTYIVAIQTPATRSIKVTATVGDVVRKIQSLATVGATTITTISWSDEDATYATISHVQSGTSTASVSLATIAQPFRGDVTAGNLIVAAVSWDTTSAIGTLTCSDNLSNAYTTVGTIWNDATNTQALGICYAPNITGGSATVTATFSAAKTTRRIVVSEYKGVATTSPVDTSTGVGGGTGTTTANAVTSGAAVPTKDGDLIYGAVVDAAGVATIAPGTGFTQRGYTNLKDLAVQDFQQLTAASVASTQTFGTAHRYNAAVVLFKAATN